MYGSEALKCKYKLFNLLRYCSIKLTGLIDWITLKLSILPGMETANLSIKFGSIIIICWCRGEGQQWGG